MWSISAWETQLNFWISYAQLRLMLCKKEFETGLLQIIPLHPDHVFCNFDWILFFLWLSLSSHQCSIFVSLKISQNPIDIAEVHSNSWNTVILAVILYYNNLFIFAYLYNHPHKLINTLIMLTYLYFHFFGDLFIGTIQFFKSFFINFVQFLIIHPSFCSFFSYFRLIYSLQNMGVSQDFKSKFSVYVFQTVFVFYFFLFCLFLLLY